MVYLITLSRRWMLTPLELESLLNTRRTTGHREPYIHAPYLDAPSKGDLFLCAQLAGADSRRQRPVARRRQMRCDDLNTSAGDPPVPAAQLPPQPSPLVSTSPPPSTRIHWRQQPATPPATKANISPTPNAPAPPPIDEPVNMRPQGCVSRTRSPKRFVAKRPKGVVPSVAMVEGLLATTRRTQELSEMVTSLQSQLTRERESYSAMLQDQAKEVRRWADGEVRRSGEVGHRTLERVVDLHTTFFSEHFMLFNRFVLEHMSLLHEHLLGRSAISARQSEADTVRGIQGRHTEELASLRAACTEAERSAAGATLALNRVREQHKTEMSTLRADHQAQILEALGAVSEVEERALADRREAATLVGLFGVESQEWEDRWRMAADADVQLSSIHGSFIRKLKSDERAYTLVRTELRATMREGQVKERQMAALLEESRRETVLARAAEEAAMKEMQAWRVQSEADAAQLDARARAERVEADRRIADLESKLAASIREAPQTSPGVPQGGGSQHLRMPFPRSVNASPTFISPYEGRSPSRQAQQHAASASPVSPNAASPDDHLRIRSLLDFMKRR